MKAGWEVKTLGEVCEVFNGGTPKTGVVEYWNGEHQWITPAEMGKRSTPYVSETARTVTNLGLKNSSARPLPPYSVILSSRAPIGHLVINTEPMATNQGCKGLVPSSSIYYKFLFFYLSSIVDLLNDLGSGATFKELSGGKLKEVTIPLPPLPEQQRIVAILDAAFASIATAKANTEQNLKNARALFDSYLHEVFDNENWETKTIHEVCDEIFAGGDAPKDNFSLEKNEKYQIPIYANAVKKNGLYGYTDFSRVTKPSITISARGSGTGHTEIRFESFLPIVRLIVLIPNLSLINLEFLKHSIDNLEILRSGSAIPQLTVPMIKEYSLPLPSLSEQQTIVQKLEVLREETQRLETLYQRKLTALDELKKALLHQAFNGEL